MLDFEGGGAFWVIPSQLAWLTFNLDLLPLSPTKIVELHWLSRSAFLNYLKLWEKNSLWNFCNNILFLESQISWLKWNHIQNKLRWLSYQQNRPTLSLVLADFLHVTTSIKVLYQNSTLSGRPLGWNFWHKMWTLHSDQKKNNVTYMYVSNKYNKLLRSVNPILWRTKHCSASKYNSYRLQGP